MSLANKLSLYMLLVTVVIFIAIGAIFLEYGARREERQVSLYASSLVDNSVNKLDSRFDRVEDHVRQHAPVVKAMLGKRSGIMDLVEHLVKSDSIVIGGSVAYVPGVAEPEGTVPPADSLFMEYVAIDPDGTVRRMHLGGTDYHYTRKQWFTDALKTGRGIWSEPYYDLGAGNRMMTTYTYPVRNDDGKIAAVVTADLSLEELSEEIEHIRPIENSVSFIISASGTYLAHPDKNLILNENIFSRYPAEDDEEIAAIAERMTEGKSGTSRIEFDGKDVLVVYEPIERSGWSIATLCSYESVMKRLGSATFAALCILAIGLVALVFFIRITLVYAMNPLKSLTKAAGEISRGNLHADLPAAQSADEIGRLTEAFAAMQTSLREQMKRLVETTREKERYESELNIARGIQMNLLPHKFSPFAEYPGLQINAMVSPAKEVGGDLYDFFFRNRRLYFAIGDVSGKGMPAALFMAVTRTLFRFVAETTDSPAEIACRLNNGILQNNDACMFVTLFTGVLNLSDGTLRFCNAGHNPAVIISKSEATMIKEKENLPIGVMDDFEYEEETINLKRGDTFFLYTDGLTEAENPDKLLFGEERMLRVLSENSEKNTGEIIEIMSDSVKDFAGSAEQSDDLTMMAIRFDCYTEHIDTDNSDSAIAAVKEITDRLAAAAGIDTANTGRICLALEEAVVNVVNYAYPQGTSGPVAIDVTHVPESEIVEITISDKGLPFDPTAAAEADTDATLAEREIGGLGIHLVRTLTDSLQYSREAGENRLTLRFRIQK